MVSKINKLLFIYLFIYLFILPVLTCTNKKCLKIGPQLAEHQSFDGNCEILRTIFKQRELSSDIPGSQKRNTRVLYCGKDKTTGDDH